MTGCDLCFVLGTYNRLELLKGSVFSCRKAAQDLDFVIVVTDGGSTDGSKEWLKQQDDVVLIEQQLPLTGAVRAFNLGFAWAVDNNASCVCHHNDDAEFVEGSRIKPEIKRISDGDRIGQIAFSFDLRGSWHFEEVHGYVYSNFGLINPVAAKEVSKAQGTSDGQWWNPIYRTYGADSEFSCWMLKLGWEILCTHAVRVHDHNAQDEMRELNLADDPNRPDSKLFWQRWKTLATICPSR